MSLTELRLVPRGPELLILGLDWEHRPLLKARLPLEAGHPRAAITLLEGLALWSGRRLPVALAAAGPSTAWITALLPEGAAWCSPLVEIHAIAPRRPRGPRLRGVADFHEAYQLRLPGVL